MSSNHRLDKIKSEIVTHRQNIRDLHPDFLVTANSWPLFLYANGKYNPNFPNHGLFQGELLVKVSLACLVASQLY